LTDVAIPSDRNVIQKEVEKKLDLRYKFSECVIRNASSYQ